MLRKITNFILDDEHHWVAILSCSHTQHMRHNPPWQNRIWVITKNGRNSKLGMKLNCKKCDE